MVKEKTCCKLQSLGVKVEVLYERHNADAQVKR